MPKSEKLKLIISYVNHIWKSRFALLYMSNISLSASLKKFAIVNIVQALQSF